MVSRSMGRLTFRRRAKELVERIVPEAVIRRYHRHRRLGYVRSLRPDYDPTKKTILALNHYYDQDLRALSLANSEYNFIVLDAPALFFGANRYYSRDVVQIRAPYESEPEANRALFRSECRLLFESLFNQYHPRLIITANDNFFWVREFIEVARQQGVRTVVLDKEGTISPHSFEAEAKRGREFTPFISDHVFVWSERQKSYWQNRHVPPEKITVLGQPRSDLFYAEHTRDVDGYFAVSRPIVTYFSYMDTAYMPLDYVARWNASWRRMKDETNEVISRLAEEFPAYNFVIKCHPQQSDESAIRKKYQRENLHVIGGAQHGNELVQRSSLIIAFQTTALIEAMFLGRKIVYTSWGPHLDDLRGDLLPFEEAAGIVIARSPDQLAEVARRTLAGDDQDFSFTAGQIVSRNAFVEEYLHRPDGSVCRRFFDAVRGFVQ